MGKILLSLFFAVFLVSIVSSKRRCNPRDYGKGSVVCVCNYSYCDDLDPIEKQPAKNVLLFESGKSGKRFEEIKLKFSEKKSNEFMNSTAITLTIDRSKKVQEIIGFGGSITDAAGININSLPMNMAINILKDYFSVNGLEYSVVRIPIAGCDFSTYAYSYDDIENDTDLTHFALLKEDYYYKISLLKLAQHFSPLKIKIFGSPWSPPKWLKTNHKFKNGGQIIGEVGGKYWQIWAEYFVKFINAYKDNGIDIWGVTVENEPAEGLNNNHPFNSLGLTPELERDFTKLNLGPTLAKHGLGPDKLKLMIHDDQRYRMINYTHTILSDKEAAKYVSGIAFHWYGNHGAGPEVLDQIANQFPNYFILNTESSFIIDKRPKEDLPLGNWEDGEQYAYDIITDLDHHTSGWIDWNMALDTRGEPSWADTQCNSPIVTNASALEYYKQPMFYAMGHFSKFLTPDSVKIGLNKPVNETGFEAIAFERTDNATVLIVLNKNNYSIPINIVDQSSGQLHYELPPKSIQSYIWWH